MVSSTPSPGPDADAAFRLGSVASVVLTILVVSLSFWSGNVTLPSAITLFVLGLPAVFVVTSCLLASWLGYDKDAIDAFRRSNTLHEHAKK